MSFKAIQFGTYTLPQEDAGNVNEIGINWQTAPLWDGVVDLHQGDMSYAGKTLPHPCTLIADDAQTIAEKYEALVDAITEGTQLLVAEDYDGNKWQTWAKCIDLKANWGLKDRGKVPVSITFGIPWPVWLRTEDEPWRLDMGYQLDTGKKLGGNSDSKAVTSVPDTLTVNNTGPEKVTRGFIWIVPAVGGEVTNIKITNQTNGLWVQYTGTVTDGDVFYVDWLSQAVMLNSANAYGDAFMLGASQAIFMRLEKGSNSFLIEAASITGTVNVYVQWSRHTR